MGALKKISHIDYGGAHELNIIQEIDSYFRKIHEHDDNLFITLLRKSNSEVNAPYHYHFKGDEIVSEVMKTSNLNVDHYASVNSFFAPKRSLATLYHLNALYVDLDCHSGVFDLNATLYWLKEEFFETEIPTPNLIVSSGRGLQLYWKIETSPIQALTVWSLLQNKLVEKLTPIKNYVQGVSVDSSCTDATRVFRIPATMNTKAEIKAYTVDSLPNKYNMNEIIDNYYSELTYKPKPKSKSATNKNRAKVHRIHSVYTLLFNRMEDLKTLVKLRNGEMGGYRDNILHIYSWTVIPKKFANEEVFYTELSGFNELFSDPLEDKEIRSKAKTNFKKFSTQALRKNTIKEYEPYERYKFKNETIIDLLGITSDEQKKMITIISIGEKYRRNNERRTPRNENGLTSREQAKEDTKAKVQELKQRGLSRSQVIKETGLSESTVKRYWK